MALNSTLTFRENYIALVREGIDSAAGLAQAAPSIMRDEVNGHIEARFRGINHREVRVSVMNATVSSAWFSKIGRYDAHHQEKVREDDARSLGRRIFAFLNGDDGIAQAAP